MYVPDTCALASIFYLTNTLASTLRLHSFLKLNLTRTLLRFYFYSHLHLRLYYYIAEAKPRKDSIEQEEEEKGHYLSDRTSMATSTSSHFTATAEEDTNASTWGSQKGMVNQSSPTSLTAPGGSTVRALSPSLHVYGSAPGIPGKIIREKRFRMFHSSDGEGPSGCGGCGTRYEVFSKFDKMSQ